MVPPQRSVHAMWPIRAHAHGAHADKTFPQQSARVKSVALSITLTLAALVVFLTEQNYLFDFSSLVVSAFRPTPFFLFATLFSAICFFFVKQVGTKRKSASLPSALFPRVMRTRSCVCPVNPVRHRGGQSQ